MNRVPEESFVTNLEGCYNEAFRYCRHLCARWTPDEASDVLHEALLYAYRHHDDLRDLGRFKPWLFRIITSTFLMAKRRHFWARFLPLSSYEPDSSVSAVYTGEQETRRKLLLEKLLSKLSDKERAALLLFELGGFSIEEIVTIQDEKSASTVKSRLSRARSRLRTMIAGEDKSLGTESSTVSGERWNLEDETIRLVSEANDDPRR